MFRLLAALVFGLALVSGASAETTATLADGRTGLISFDSYSPLIIGDVLSGRVRERPATISGTLTLPPEAARGGGKIPAMVIAHGSGGIGSRERDWAKRINDWGMAAFIVDSFTGRGITSTSEDQSQVSQVAGAIDAFQALKLLATHPAIDPARIGVMGMSKGGGVAMYTIFDKFRRSVIDGPLKFAAHIPLYPGCGLALHSTELTRAPILHLHGEADNWTPVAPCLAWMEWLRGQGVPAESRVYAGAYHGFDGGGPLILLNRVQTFRRCDEYLDLDTYRRYDRLTGATPPIDATFQAAFDRCGVRGAHVGIEPTAQRQAIAEVRAFLARVFKFEIR